MTSLRKLRFLLTCVTVLSSAGLVLLLFHVTLSRTTTTGKHEINARTQQRNVTSLIEHRTENVIVIRALGNTTSRIHQMNEAIGLFRQRLLFRGSLRREQHTGSEAIAAPSSSILINGDNYLTKIYNHRHIVTMLLPWQKLLSQDLTQQANLEIAEFYPWTATNEMCSVIEGKSRLPGIYVKVFRGMPCNTAIKEAANKRPLNYGHLKSMVIKRYQKDYYTTPPENSLFFHIITSPAVISAKGNVISNGLKLVPDYCGRNKILGDRVAPSKYNQLPFYDEVFTIAHPPGGAVYHGMLEELPRIAPYLEFLQRHPSVKIHASRSRRVLEMLRVYGLNTSRVVGGPVRANIVYLPRLAVCMLPRAVETQLMSRAYRQYIHTVLQLGKTSSPPDSILLIIRTGKRQFEKPEKVTAVTQSVAKAFGLRHTTFADNPLPTLNDTMILFNDALVVVAAHGAGLSNIVFCRPKTLVIEIVPFANITPLCYLHTAHILGNHWHGILSRKGRFKVVQVYAVGLDNVLRRYLQQMTT